MIADSPVMTDADDFGSNVEHEDRVLAKQKLKEALLGKLEVMQDDPLRFYRPHDKQDAFHRAGVFKHRAVFAGNRFGKSQMGVAEDAAFVSGCRSWYPENDPARIAGIPQRPVKLLIITTDWDKVDEIFTSERGERGKLWRMLPRGFVKNKKRNHSGAIEMMEMTNGSVIRFDTVKSFEVNPQGSESSDWDAIHIDEPCSEDQYKAAARGLMDRGGSDWFTLTPLKEPWIYDKFFSRVPGQDELDMKPSHWAVRGTTYDNTYLSKAAIEDYEASLTEDERQCRLLGVPLELSGLVFKEFSYTRNVYKETPIGWEDMSLPPKHWPIWVSIDPHPQTPAMVLFCAASPHGQLFFYDEIFKSMALDELADSIKTRIAGYNCVRVSADPWIFTEHALTGQCIARELAHRGLRVTKASKDLSGGIMLTQQELRKEDRVYVSDRLRNTLFEFAHYVWAARENKPKDKNDHAMECFRRILQEGPRWFDTTRSSAPIPEIDFKVGHKELFTI
jgi:hypothetical protein